MKKTEDSNVKHTKESIMSSSKYADYKDVINILLDKDTEYSIDEVDKMIDEFLKGEVE
ncbi:MAG: hypothetical protein E6040_11810 [Lachnospiraceae bacterium]|nr:hypothetical protein [Lachnospiraceae bacterium]